MKKENKISGRIEDKVEEIENYIQELEEIIPSSYEEYINDNLSKAACERYFEKIVEAVVDLAFLIIKSKESKIPESDLEVFDILFKHNLISFELSEKLKDAKRMRNVIVHEYGKIDDPLVYHSLTEELINDVLEFVKCIKEKS